MSLKHGLINQKKKMLRMVGPKVILKASPEGTSNNRTLIGFRYVRALTDSNLLEFQSHFTVTLSVLFDQSHVK